MKIIKDKDFSLLNACKLNWIEYVEFILNSNKNNKNLIQALKYTICKMNNFKLTECILNNDKNNTLTKFSDNSYRYLLFNYLCKNGKFTMIKKLVDYYLNIWYSNLYDKSKFHELLLMKKEISMIFVSHNMKYIKADKVYKLEKGKLTLI